MSDDGDARPLQCVTSVRKRRVVPLLAIGCVLLVSLSLVPRRLDTRAPPDPICKGKSVSSWVGSIKTLNREDDAVKTLIQIGQPAVLFLTKSLEPKHAFFTKWKLYWSIWQKAPNAVRRQLPAPYNPIADGQQRRIAAQLLGLIGPSAQAALPALVKASGAPDNGLRCFCTQAIWQIRANTKDASRCLIDRLNDEDLVVRFQAARALAILGSDEPQAMHALSGLVESTNIGLQSLATVGIWRLDPRPDRFTMVSNLFIAAPLARVWIAFVLGEIGAPATNAIPLLQTVLHDGDEQVRTNAHNAIEKIQRKAGTPTEKN